MDASPLIIPKILLTPKLDLYELHEEVTYSLGDKSVTIPAGYQYDGASIPLLFWEPIGTPFHPAFMPAALPHDRGYDTHEYDKEWFDELFYRVLIETGVSHIKAKLMFDAVHVFGHSHWGNDKAHVYSSGDG